MSEAERIVEILNSLYSCGVREETWRVGWEIAGGHILNNVLLRYEFFGYSYRIYVDLREGVKVDMRRNVVLCEDGENAVFFPPDVDGAKLCQILHILTSRRVCEGLTRDECCAFKRVLIAGLLE